MSSNRKWTKFMLLYCGNGWAETDLLDTLSLATVRKQLSDLHSLKTYKVSSDKSHWGLGVVTVDLFSYTSLSINTFQPSVWGLRRQCGVIYLTLWDLGFDLSLVTPLGLSAMRLFVNLPILFANTDHDKQRDLCVWIASDIIWLNLLKAAGHQSDHDVSHLWYTVI